MEESYDEQAPEKKRRLSPKQELVHQLLAGLLTCWLVVGCRPLVAEACYLACLLGCWLLERQHRRAFLLAASAPAPAAPAPAHPGLPNELEPKNELARRLGMTLRQVAVWFQNRRKRWKKQLEMDFCRLKDAYDTLLLDHDSLQAQHMGMQSQSAILPWSCVGDSRMDDMYIELDALDQCAVDGSKKPCNLKFSFLQFITKQFSDELKIGHGGCGLVYKGILPNQVIAVKKLLNNHTIDDKMFHQEVTSLMMVAHKNTVRLLGYCSHTEEKAIDVAGKIIMAEIRERLLCFEYVTNGSLENHITDELRGLEWYTRFQIIKGICEGLHHLHREKHIIHLDLKPANILLDDDMVPKISDFGLSRFDEKSHTLSAERLLTLGYCAPEYLQHGKRSAKSDIYSLGVIITELVTGSRGNPCITKVLRRWKHKWNKSAVDTHNKSAVATQLWFKQVSTCLDLALRCKHSDPTDRPNIWDIITDLNKMDNADVLINNDTECLKLNNMLDIEPLEIHFPFELNKHIPSTIELTNDTDDYFAFRMSSISIQPYFIHPFKGIVPPQSKCSVTIMLQPQERLPPQFPCKDEFSVQSTRVDMNLAALDITEDMFHEELGKVVDEVTLKVVLDSPSPPGSIRADSIGMAGSVPLTFSTISSTLGQIL